MKNKIYAIITLALAVFSFSSCEKELMGYEGKDCLYFDVRRGASWNDKSIWPRYNYSEVTFGKIIGNDTTLTLRVTATGNIKDYDRPFTVIVAPDSTDVEANTEYEPLAPQYYIKAGETHADIDITFNRTARMEDDTLRMQLMILPNEHFDLKYDAYGDYPGVLPDTYAERQFNRNNNARYHNLYIDDVLTQPAGWWGTDYGGLFGRFSPTKYKFIMQVTGTNINDYASQATMSSGRATAISQAVAKELIKRAQAKDPVLDRDGTMMWVSYVNTLGGKDAWTQYTRPEAYYQYR